MIEVMQASDLERIDDPAIREYLRYRLASGGLPADPVREGYFLYLSSAEDLRQPLNLSYALLPGFDDELWRYVEALECSPAVLELSVALNNEFLLSIVLPRSPKNEALLDEYLLEHCHD